MKDYAEILSASDWQSEMITLPLKIYRWLSFSNSLTVAMEQHCQQLHLQLLEEQHSEKQSRRVVLLKGDMVPWLYAHTHIYWIGMDKRQQEVSNLGTMPIGKWLFKQVLTRTNCVWRQDEKTGLYARKVDWQLGCHRVEIQEVFLDDFPFELVP